MAPDLQSDRRGENNVPTLYCCMSTLLIRADTTGGVHVDTAGALQDILHAGLNVRRTWWNL